MPGTLADAPAQVVTASARLGDEKAAAITRGSEFDAFVTVTLLNGWHIYANPTGVPELKPTTLDLSSARSIGDVDQGCLSDW